ncbi:desmocollin 2-like protein [Aulostomus maculatus]
MASVSILCVMLVLSRVESCYLPNSLHLFVPQEIQVGHEITRVEVSDCDIDSLQVTLTDSDFAVRGNGAVVAVKPLTMEAKGRTFSVLAQDTRGPQSEMVVHLYKSPQDPRKGFLKRSKRRWSPPPFNILENDKGIFPKNIDKIVSDSEAKHRVYYTISGPGYNQHPVGVFTLDTNTGMLSVNKPVDREEFPQFVLTAEVFDVITKQPTDEPLDIHIIVDDENDNAPQFKSPLSYSVLEKSKPRAEVGKVEATDRDQPGSLHVKIRYSLLTGLDLFAIDPATGVITTVTDTLDREVKDKYNVVVQIKDMDGAVNGLSSTGTAVITVGDINDNPPTFTKASYDATIMENQSDKLLLRIPVEDKDLVNTPNWVSKFLITKGNENGYFRIERDPKTNEGLLYVAKPLDYEKNKNINLEIMARNEADLTGTTAQWLTIPVKVAVTDEDEGPEFTAPSVRYVVKENVKNGTLLGSYTALDPETKSSDGIKYYKVSDPGSWINIDRNNGEVKVANTIDRESEMVKDGLYPVIVKAVDASSKTGTGTIILQVEDENDNAPKIPTSLLLVCEKEGELGSVLVVAEDMDQSPFSAPFIFSLPSDHDGKWSVKRYNDTAATLQHVKDLPTGTYDVPLYVSDLQGFGKKQTAKVRICECRNGQCLNKPLSISLGPMALLAMLLPLALLLLLCLLLAFFCVTRREKIEVEDTGDSGGILLTSNTEAPGEEVDSSLIIVPTSCVDQPVKGSVKGSVVNAGWMGNKSGSTLGVQDIQDSAMYNSAFVTTDTKEYNSQFNAGHLLGSGMTFDNRNLMQGSSFLHTWQTNGRYLHQKLAFLGTEEDGRYADDIIHSYGFEGVGSAAGSVGCCSDYDDNDTLDFLNTLGPKFKTLAGVCTKT